MVEFLENAPHWFENLFSRALQTGDHDSLEAILGIARLLNGSEEEALRLKNQLEIRLITNKQAGIRGESGSTQLEDMLDSGLYPKDLCTRIRMELG